MPRIKPGLALAWRNTPRRFAQEEAEGMKGWQCAHVRKYFCMVAEDDGWPLVTIGGVLDRTGPSYRRTAE